MFAFVRLLGVPAGPDQGPHVQGTIEGKTPNYAQGQTDAAKTAGTVTYFILKAVMNSSWQMWVNSSRGH